MLSCYTKALLLSSPSLVRGSAISCTKTISWAYAISPLQQTLGLLKFKIMLKFPSKSPFSVMVFWANSNQQHRALAASSTNPPGLQEKWAAGSSPASGLCGSCAQAALSATGLMQLARSWAKLNPYLPEGLSFLATSLPIAFNKLKKKKKNETNPSVWKLTRKLSLIDYQMLMKKLRQVWTTGWRFPFLLCISGCFIAQLPLWHWVEPAAPRLLPEMRKLKLSYLQSHFINLIVGVHDILLNIKTIPQNSFCNTLICCVSLLNTGKKQSKYSFCLLVLCAEQVFLQALA